MENETLKYVDNQTKISKPKMYKVIMHNDDYTPMDFVVEILISIFLKNAVEASKLMFSVHKLGNAVVAIYTFDIAMTKKSQADIISERKGYPLKISIEEEKSK